MERDWTFLPMWPFRTASKKRKTSHRTAAIDSIIVNNRRNNDDDNMSISLGDLPPSEVSMDDEGGSPGRRGVGTQEFDSSSSSSLFTNTVVVAAAAAKSDDTDDVDSTQLLTDKKFRDTLLYVAKSEETQTRAAAFSFCKKFPNDEDHWMDWTDNHFLQKDMEEQPGDAQLFFSSYDFGPGDIVHNDDTDDPNDDQCWIKFPSLSSVDSLKPKIPKDKLVQSYLEHLKQEQPNRFQSCGENLRDMIPYLTKEDIPKEEWQGEEVAFVKTRDFVVSAVKYANSLNMKAVGPAFEKLYAHKHGKSELVAGFGHVRMVYSTGSSTSKNDRIIVNGPLFEVPFDVTFEQGEIATAVIRPAKDADITFNSDVITALHAVGGDNQILMDKLIGLEKQIKVSSIRLGNPECYRKLLEAARMLRCNGEVVPATDSKAHDAPPDPDFMRVTDAFCFFSRKKATTSFSEDARNLIEARDRGQNKLKISEPLRALLWGPNYLNGCTADSSGATNDNPGKTRLDDLVFPLPASEKQREVADRLFVKGESVVALEGPPGTGKTHTIVNIASTGLSMGKTILVTSKNTNALKAFAEKLPDNLRPLVLDITCLQGGDASTLRKSLEKLDETLKNISIRDGVINRLTKEIADMKKKQATLKNAMKQRLFQNEDMRDVMTLARRLLMRAPWLANAIVTGNSDLNLMTIIQRLDGRLESAESISFEIDNPALDKQLFDLVEEKAKGRSVKFNPAHAKKLASVTIDGRSPVTQADWGLVLRELQFRNDCKLPLIRCGCSEEEIDGKIGPSILSELLKECLELKKAIDYSRSGLKDVLRAIATDDVSSSRVMQEQYRRLTFLLQELEAELVYEKVAASLKEKVDAQDLSELVSLIDDLQIYRQSLTTTNTSSERAIRHRNQFKQSLKNAAKFMPVLLMTTDQVSDLLEPGHSFDVAIIDETSQSDCTAITIMARCEQLLAVGDDKQVSPSTVGLGEERIRWLERRLPDIPTKRKLLPESSFFALIKSTFPLNTVALFEHFRCDPRIIAISNEIFYDNRLVPLRLESDSMAVETILVEGALNKDKGKKTNSVEAEYIANRICDYIRANAKNTEYKTIGALSTGGPDQAKLMRKEIEQKCEALNEDPNVGPKKVNRHKIFVGTPDQFQGCERAIVFISSVDVPNKSKKGEVKKLWYDQSIAAEKKWNVGSTRARDEMYWVRSFGLQDLHVNDIRHEILQLFMEPEKGEMESHASSKKSDPLTAQVERKVSDFLKRSGFKVKKHGGKIWPNALVVDSRALVLVENRGEDLDEWETAWNEQQSLESAGRSCLRVDLFSLGFNFDAACQDILEFLRKCGVTPMTDCAAARAAPSVDAKRRAVKDATMGGEGAKKPRKE